MDAKGVGWEVAVSDEVDEDGREGAEGFMLRVLMAMHRLVALNRLTVFV